MKLGVWRERGFKQVHGAKVSMDGRPLARVFKVDTTTGVAWVHATDAAGQPMIDRDRREAVVRKVYGPMRVEPPA